MKRNWTVKFSKRSQKQFERLPTNLQKVVEELVVELQDRGPVRGDWPNYSKLAETVHHCHLTYRYVAVWMVVGHEIRLIEVIYVGSRENAPY